MKSVSLSEFQLETIKRMILEGQSDDAIKSFFQGQNIDENALLEVARQVKRIRNAKLTRQGSILILIGVLILGIGFISCILIHYNGGAIGFSLYGLTAIGLVLLVIGLAMIFH